AHRAGSSDCCYCIRRSLSPQRGSPLVRIRGPRYLEPCHPSEGIVREREADMTEDRFTDDERAAIYRLLRARRDVRHFRPDPVPDAGLRRMLEAAPLAPSVGFMQPWNFVLIRSLEIRQRVRESFEARNREQLAAVPGEERKELYRQLKLEGILEAPLNVA